MHTEFSLRHKLKSSFLCFSGDHRHDGDSCYSTLHAPKSPPTPCSPSSSCSWRKKSPAGDFSDHHRGRSRYLLSRIGWKHHRRAQSADFSYDPSSYALNFEDDSRIEGEDFPFRGFASRLKHSPPQVLVTMPREIVGCS
ncbi:uncharacterized protein LOC114754526 [Neltuma alba]|uniref:uncharacterized protein LOC114754526 n=1 Tax=Neltuma alba TaxID=207710 RepID=UPI0010A3C8E7|nr:uncharacterized protein LOC114754526 [Prosopis alba]